MAIRKGQLTIFRCAWCDKVMVDGRADKKFDTPTCRKRYSRWKQKVDKLERDCLKNFEILNDYLNHFATRDKAATVVKNLELAAKRLLIENDVQNVK